MKKLFLLSGCLVLLVSCGSMDKGHRQAAEIPAKVSELKTSIENPKLLRCYKKAYSRRAKNQKIKQIVLGVYESTTDQYSNFFQLKVTSNKPVLTSNGLKSFDKFEAGGTCNMVMSPYPNPMNLDCAFTDDGAIGSFGLYEQSQDSKNKRDHISLLKKMEIQKMMAEHVGDAGYIAKLEVEDDEINRSHSLQPYNLNDCRQELKFVLSE